jgi:transmembrane sensor
MDDSLLYRALSGQATEAERRTVEVWRRASPAHEARYRELALVLQATAAARPAPTTPPPVLEVLQAAADRGRVRARRAQTWRWAAAAVLLVATGALATWRGGWPGASREFGFEEMVTGENQTVTVALRDGSVMRLAPRSQARIRVRDGVREVHLTGRAFFSVAKQRGLPFMVRTQGGDLTVLGTQFDVDARNSDVKLVVVEGKVALAGARGGETRVERGQSARVVAGQLVPAVVAVPEARDSTRWVGRFLAFQRAPLPEVVRELELAYGVRVTVADSALATQTVSSWFSDRPLEEVVQVVCAILATPCTVAGQAVTIGRSPDSLKSP